MLGVGIARGGVSPEDVHIDEHNDVSQVGVLGRW